MKTKADRLLVVLVIFLFISLVWFHEKTFVPAEKVSLFYNGNVVKDLPLSKDQVSSINLGNNTVKIEIKGGKARILESHCKRQVCKHAGWIKRVNESIICVPNKFVMEVNSSKRNDGAYKIKFGFNSRE